MAGIDLNSLETDSPEALAAAFLELENGGDANLTEEPPKAPEPEAKADPVKQETQEEKQGQSEPDGVLTKDGKHVIPYSVLKADRDRATRAEQVAREMQERVASLEAQIKAGNQGANNGEGARTTPASDALDDLSNEDLEALKEDFPTVYKGLIATQNTLKSLEAKLKPVEESYQSRETEQARTQAEQVQDAIDSVPKLAHIQATDKDAFELAKQFDKTLRDQSAWKDKPLADRFEKITEMVEAALGQIALPAKNQPSAQLSAAELRAAAEAKANASTKANKTAVPTSLSEFPVGDPAAADEQEAAQNMSVLQLADKFGRMSPDQVDAYLQNL